MTISDERWKSARIAILEEVGWLLKKPSMPEALKNELHRIQRLAMIEDHTALDEIHNRALNLESLHVGEEISVSFELIMSIARHGLDVRSKQDLEKHSK